MKKIGLIFFLCCSSILFWQCQKDDICSEATQTTPLLIIRFLDYNNPEEFKAVPNLTVRATSEEENFLTSVDTDSIAIPLKTFQNFTEYEFIKNDPIPDEDNQPDPNMDIMNFSYAPEQRYLSRGCGYIVNYVMNNATVEGEALSQRWIKDISIQQLIVEDEITAHIYILH